AVERGGAADSRTVLLCAPRLCHKPIGLYAQARGHSVEAGLVDEELRTVDPQSAIANQYEAERVAQIHRQRERRAEAPRRIAARGLQDVVPYIASADRGR